MQIITKKSDVFKIFFLYMSEKRCIFAPENGYYTLIYMQTIKLNNGVEMPILGYGVFQVPPQEAEKCVSDALEVGYRMIDTAQAYGNEEGVGEAIVKSGIPRDELFVVTKVWITNAGEERAAKSIEASLRKL